MPRRPFRRTVLTALCACSLAAGARAQNPRLPPGFVLEPIAGGWDSPAGLAFIDETRLLVAERDGRIFYVEDDQRHNLVIDLREETLVNGDRGMLGIAVDPSFDLNGWLYLLYVVDTNAGGDGDPLAYSRLIKVRTELDAGGNLLALPGTRQHLFGDQWSTGITSCHLSHTIGTMRFLSDGSLVLTSGDNAHFDATDAGGIDPNCFLEGRTPIEQDVGAYRSQLDQSLCGKVLRLDPETGWGLPGNPGYDPDDPASILSRVYARGLRNPFRLALLPGSGPREAIFIADVGWNRWEEINVARFGGENFGWPCFEGNRQQLQYQARDPFGFCPGVAAAHTPPLMAWHHTAPGEIGFAGNCATGLAVYRGELYPPLYHGRLFFADFGRNWLKAARLGEDLTVTNIVGFGRDMGGPVDLVEDPATGDLVYARLGPPGVFRLRYVGSNEPPSAVMTATPAWGGLPLEVAFDATQSQDPEGGTITFLWDLGDGTTSSQATLVHTFTEPQNFVAHLTVTDDEGRTGVSELVISPGNTPPRVTELGTSLPDGQYQAGVPFHVSGAAEDTEDGASITSRLTLDLVHDHHVHPDWASAVGLDATFVTEVHDADGDNHFELRLRATDSRGLSDELSLSLFDAHSTPKAHLVDLPDDSVRVGQPLTPTGHVDFALASLSGREPTLTWDWGDGTTHVFPDVGHHEDTRPTHTYARAGSYPLKLTARIDDFEDVETAIVTVGSPRPAVALFAPMQLERWVQVVQQQAIFDALSAGLDHVAGEVTLFQIGDGELVTQWMENFLDDHVLDVLVLVDFAPASTFAGESDGSLLERWIEHGNGLVWTGQTPFAETLADDGTTLSTGQGSLGADRILDAVLANCALGSGLQLPTPLGSRDLPALAPYHSQRALLYPQLGFEFLGTRLYADSAGHTGSDALEARHLSGGFYAQFLCALDSDLPRPEVLTQFLRSRLGRVRTITVEAPR